MRADLAAQFHLCAVRHRLVEIHVLAGEIDRVGMELDLIVKLVVEVERGERQPIAPESLFKAGFPRAVLLGLEVRDWAEPETFPKFRTTAESWAL